MASTSPQSRRDRPAKPALSREAIVAAAIKLMETESSERLTLRRLAADLDTGPASLYVYVRNTADLYAHVLEDKLGTLDLAWDPGKTPWMERLSTLLMSYLELLMQYSSLGRSALLSRPTGDNYLALVEMILTLLTAGGAPAERTAWGSMCCCRPPRPAPSRSLLVKRPRTNPTREALTEAIQNAPPDTFPLIAGLGLELVSGPGEAPGCMGLRGPRQRHPGNSPPDEGSLPSARSDRSRQPRRLPKTGKFVSTTRQIDRRRFLVTSLGLPAAALLAGCDENDTTAAQRQAESSGRGPLPPTPACTDDDDEVTPSQTEGPYFTPNSPLRRSLLEPGMQGRRLRVMGRVLDTDCRPIPRAILDFWQADADGEYDNEGFRLRGHQRADSVGRFRLDSVVPGAYPGRTRHLHVKVARPRSSAVLTTQLYLPGERLNASDGIFDQALLMRVSRSRGRQLGRFAFVLA